MPTTHAPYATRNIQTVSIDGQSFQVNTARRTSHSKASQDMPFEAMAHFFRPDYRERMTTSK